MSKAETEAKDTIAKKKGGAILEKNFDVLSDCSNDNFDYFAASGQKVDNSVLYGTADNVGGFSSQKQENEPPRRKRTGYQALEQRQLFV